MDRFSVGKPKLLASPTADARPCSSARGKRENVREFAWCFRRPFADGLKSVSVLAALSQFCKRTPIATRGRLRQPRDGQSLEEPPKSGPVFGVWRRMPCTH